jgi:hypothetical protein
MTWYLSIAIKRESDKQRKSLAKTEGLIYLLLTYFLFKLFFSLKTIPSSD